MRKYLEIEGGSIDNHTLWTTSALCPLTNDNVKAPFCLKRNICELPEVGVRAVSGDEAREFLAYALTTGGIARCEAGKQFSFKAGGIYPLRFYRAALPGDEYIL